MMRMRSHHGMPCSSGCVGEFELCDFSVELDVFCFSGERTCVAVDVVVGKERLCVDAIVDADV